MRVFRAASFSVFGQVIEGAYAFGLQYPGRAWEHLRYAIFIEMCGEVQLECALVLGTRMKVHLHISNERFRSPSGLSVLGGRTESQIAYHFSSLSWCSLKSQAMLSH